VKSKLEKKAPPKPKPKGKLSKKERMKQELLGELSPGMADIDAKLANAEKEEYENQLKTYENQVISMLGQMVQRAHLGPDDKVTLSEFCDLIWRGGNFSPLDEDVPVKTKDEFDEDDDDASDALATKIEL